MKKWLKKDIIWLILLLILSLWQVRFLFLPGFYTFSDEPHVANLYEMVRALHGNQLPPRWAPDVSYNFGSPLFNFYYPLPFYLGSFFVLAFGFSLITSLKLVFGLSVVLSGIVFYFLAKKFFRPIPAFATAVVYLFTPYRAVELYVRGAVGEMWLFAFLPLALLSFVNLAEKKTARWSALAAFSLGGMVLAHSLAFVLAIPVVFLFMALSFFWAPKKERRKILWRQGVAVFWGMAISAYYWLPAITEKKFLQPGTPFNPYDHFPFLRQLIIPFWGYGASVWGPGDGMSFQVGIVNWIVFLLAGLLMIFFRNKLTRQIFFLSLALFACFGGSVFLMNIRSWFLWQALPLGEYIQFPWRLLLLTSFASSFMVGLTDCFGRLKLPLLLSLLAIILTAGYFHPHKTMNVDDNYYLRRFFADRLVTGKSESESSEYRNYSEDYLPLTVWTQKRPSFVPEKVQSAELGAKLSFQEITPTNYRIEIETDKDTRLTINNYYFPGWKAKIDGVPVPVRPISPLGQIKIDVPKGNHLILTGFTETPVRAWSNFISLVTGWLALIAVFYNSKWNKVLS